MDFSQVLGAQMVNKGTAAMDEDAFYAEFGYDRLEWVRGTLRLLRQWFLTAAKVNLRPDQQRTQVN